MKTIACLVCALLVACGDDGGVNELPDAPVFPDAPEVDAARDGSTNAAPIATVGAARAGLVGRTVKLASLATDAEGDALTFSWGQTAGPTVTLDGADTATPAFLPRAVGVYEFSLVVSDGMSDSIPVATTVSVHDLDGGEDFTLGLRPDGTLLAWGENFFGELGDGTSTDRHVPGRVCDTDASDCTANPFPNAVAIAAGRSHALALTADGSVWAWGDDVVGQLGQGGIGSSSTPHPVCNVGATDCTADPLTGVVHITAGFVFSVALKGDGTVVAWGHNREGQLGTGDLDDSPVPIHVCGPGAKPPCTPASGNILRNVRELAAGGGGHTIAILTNGSVVAWGHNKSGQVGNADAGQRVVTIPTPVCEQGETAPCSTSITNVVAIDAWSGHSLALRADGSLWGWGSNDESELGAVTPESCSGTICSTTPVPVCLTGDTPCTTPLAGVESFTAGRRFSVALRADGSVLAWGDNSESELGDGSSGGVRTVPDRVCAAGEVAPCTSALTGVSAIATGSFHALALRADGSLVAWGDNEFGQLGDNSVDDRAIPIVVSGY